MVARVTETLAVALVEAAPEHRRRSVDAAPPGRTPRWRGAMVRADAASGRDGRRVATGRPVPGAPLGETGGEDDGIA